MASSWRKRNPFRTALLVFLLLILPLYGEDVWMRDGRYLKGVIIGQSRTKIRMKRPGGKIVILLKRDIIRISYASPVETKKEAPVQNPPKDDTKAREEEMARREEELERYKREQEERDALQKQQDQKYKLARSERLHHSRLMQERIRLQRTSGTMEFTGGTTLEVVVMKKKGGRFWVRSRVGNLEVIDRDIRNMKVMTDNGLETITPDEIRGVMEYDLEGNEVQLTGGQIIQGEVASSSVNSFLFATEGGDLPIRSDDLKANGLPTPPPWQPGIHLKPGESGLFVLTGDQNLEGTLILYSKNSITFDTDFGRLEMHPDQVLYAGPLPESIQTESPKNTEESP